MNGPARPTTWRRPLRTTWRRPASQPPPRPYNMAAWRRALPVRNSAAISTPPLPLPPSLPARAAPGMAVGAARPPSLRRRHPPPSEARRHPGRSWGSGSGSGGRWRSACWALREGRPQAWALQGEASPQPQPSSRRFEAELSNLICSSLIRV